MHGIIAALRRRNIKSKQSPKAPQVKSVLSQLEPLESIEFIPSGKFYSENRDTITTDPETAIIGVDKSTYSPVKERLEREYEKNNGLVPQFYSQWLIELGEKNSHENSYEWIRYLLKQKRISTVYVEHETLVTHLNQGKRFAKKERGEALIASVMLKNGYRWDSTKVALVRGVTGWQRTKHLTLALIFLSMIVASIYTIFKHISGG